MINPERNVSLAQYTHYKIGGVARETYSPATAKEFHEILQYFKESGTDYFILGGGSNTLVGDGYYDGAVVLTHRMDWHKTFDGYILCGAGMASSKIAEIALEHAKTGLEFLYLLPGSIGGALAGNARFDNINVSDMVVWLTAVHPEEGIKEFGKSVIQFGYKFNSIIQEGWYICEIAMKWENGDESLIRQRMEEIEKERSDSHHFDFPSSGCIFKNDHSLNIQAGRLIDSLGLKGLTVGGAQVAQFHANFIINTGNATASDVLELIEKIEKTVYEKTGIRLEREVRLQGTF